MPGTSGRRGGRRLCWSAVGHRPLAFEEGGVGHGQADVAAELFGEATVVVGETAAPPGEGQGPDHSAPADHRDDQGGHGGQSTEEVRGQVDRDAGGHLVGSDLLVDDAVAGVDDRDRPGLDGLQRHQLAEPADVGLVLRVGVGLAHPFQVGVADEVDHAHLGHVGDEQGAHVVEGRGVVQPAGQECVAGRDEAEALFDPMVPFLTSDPVQVLAQVLADAGEHRDVLALDRLGAGAEHVDDPDDLAPCSIGKANPVRRPEASAAFRRRKSGSTSRRSTERGTPLAHTWPASPVPGVNVVSRVAAWNRWCSCPGALHMPSTRSAPQSSSTTHRLVRSQSSRCPMTRRRPPTASATGWSWANSLTSSRATALTASCGASRGRIRASTCSRPSGPVTGLSTAPTGTSSPVALSAGRRR